MKNIIKRLSVIGIIGYTSLLVYFMLWGFGRRYIYSYYMYNLKPFKTINLYLQVEKFNTNIWVINLFGNIGVFIPFGILLPIIFGGKIVRSFVIFFIGLFTIESLQLLSRRGSFDIDDFILNSLGFFIGYGIYKVVEMVVNLRK